MNRSLFLSVSSLILLITAAIAFAQSPAPTPGSEPTPSCTEDRWECSSWGECNESGSRSRGCELSFDCSTVDTPMPPISETCGNSETEVEDKTEFEDPAVRGIKMGTCSLLESLQERVACKVKTVSEGDTTHYATEECLKLKDDAEAYANCSGLHAAILGCSETYPTGHPQRFSCVEEKLGLSDIQKQKEECEKDEKCLSLLTRNVYTLIDAHIYDLEEKAYRFLKSGAGLEPTIKLIQNVEEARIELVEASSYIDRLHVLVNLRNNWKNYVEEVKNDINR